MSWVFSGYVLTVGLGTLTLLITSRALGPSGLGIVALVEAYVRVAGRLLRIEPWQAIIRYASEALTAGNRQHFVGLIKLSILVDMVSGLVAGCGAMLLAHWVAPLIGLPDDSGATMVALYAAGLLFSFRATAVAVLRTFDRFDLLAKTDVVAALVRFGLALVAYWAGLGIWAFIGILLVQSLLDGLLAMAFAFVELRRRNYSGLWAASARMAVADSPGILRFLWNSNFNVVLRQTANRLDILALGALLDPVAVGYYHLGKRLMNSAVKAAAPLRQTLYPEMTRLWFKDRKKTFFRLLLVSTAGLLTVGTLAVVPAIWKMEALVTVLFGPEYVGASTAMSLLLGSTLVYISTVMFNPALLSMGRDRLLVRATMCSIAVFAAAFLPLVMAWGVEGAALGNLLNSIVWAAICGVALVREASSIKL